MNEDKIMDKINKNLKIIDSLLMENGFYKYISKVVNIEDGTSQLYDNLKHLQQENERLKVNCNLGYEELKVDRDYKSRCEKALEYLDKVETLAMSDGKIIFSINIFRNILQNEKK